MKKLLIEKLRTLFVSKLVLFLGLVPFLFSARAGAQPFVSIDDVTVMEPDTGTIPAVFTVTLDAAFAQNLIVSFATANGTATAPTDYVAQSGDLVFAPGETSKTITVLVNGDVMVEGTENYFVNLLGLSGFLGEDPTFGNRMDYPVGQIPDDEDPQEAVNADFNGDGILDLAVTVRAEDFGTPNVAILLGIGDGTFGMASHVTTATMDEPRAIGTSDFNGDGIPDLAVVNYAEFDPPGRVTILLGDGDGIFTEAALSPKTLSGDLPRAIAIADFDGDGDQDLAITIKDDDTIDILLGNGNGTFAFAAESPIMVGDDPRGITSGDFNGDLIPDLAIANHFDENITVLLGDGDGTFTQAPMSPIPVDDETANIATADFNNDGILDLVTPVDGGNVSVLFGIGDGTFGPETLIMVGSDPKWVAIADFNGDGRPDMAVSNNGDDNVSILKNETPPGAPAPIFTNPTTLDVGDRPVGETIGDFNDDGRPDLAVVNRFDDDVTVWINTTPTPMIVKPQGIGTIEEMEIVVTCITGSGNPFNTIRADCANCSLNPYVLSRGWWLDYQAFFLFLGILAAALMVRRKRS